MTLHVSLTPALERYVREKVRSGLHGTAREVVREALRLMAERDLDLEARRERLRSGSPSVLHAEGQRLREEFDLCDAGCALMEQKLRRDFPAASEHEIQDRLRQWRAGSPRSEEVEGHLKRAPDRLARLLRDET